ncbi:MAG: hypothetical protein ACRCYU_04510 [Nocardioides sp.]
MIRELAIGVAAGAAVLVLTILLSDMSPRLQVSISVGVGIAASCVGHLASRGAQSKRPSSVRVGTDIDSRGAVRISDVATRAGSEQTTIGTDIRADHDVSIEGIQVDSQKPKEE